MMLRLCHNCKHFKQNKPNTPIFINGLWWGGPDAGRCLLKTNPHTWLMGGHVVDTDGCFLWESDKPDLITFKGVNCPACGRFMRRGEDMEYVVEHTHNMFTSDPEYTHTHAIVCEIWKCACGTLETVEVFDDHEEPAGHFGYTSKDGDDFEIQEVDRMFKENEGEPLNTRENPEPW